MNWVDFCIAIFNNNDQCFWSGLGLGPKVSDLYSLCRIGYSMCPFSQSWSRQPSRRKQVKTAPGKVHQAGRMPARPRARREPNCETIGWARRSTMSSRCCGPYFCKEYAGGNTKASIRQTIHCVVAFAEETIRCCLHGSMRAIPASHRRKPSR